MQKINNLLLSWRHRIVFTLIHRFRISIKSSRVGVLRLRHDAKKRITDVNKSVTIKLMEATILQCQCSMAYNRKANIEMNGAFWRGEVIHSFRYGHITPPPNSLLVCSHPFTFSLMHWLLCLILLECHVMASLSAFPVSTEQRSDPDSAIPSICFAH